MQGSRATIRNSEPRRRSEPRPPLLRDCQFRAATARERCHRGANAPRSPLKSTLWRAEGVSPRVLRAEGVPPRVLRAEGVSPRVHTFSENPVAFSFRLRFS
jgi:hypothetical protein